MKSGWIPASFCLLSVFTPLREACAVDMQNPLFQRSETAWHELAQSDKNKFDIQAQQFKDLYGGALTACEAKVNQNYSDHPEYFADLSRQQLQFQKSCHAQCKASSGDPGAAERTCELQETNDFTRVKKACELTRTACASEPSPTGSTTALKCDCEELCDDPVITNYAEIAKSCGDGILASAKMTYTLLGAAIKNTYEGITNPEATGGALANFWRANFSTVAVNETTIRGIMILQAQMKDCQRNLAPPKADYVGAKIDELALSCMSPEARKQLEGNKGSSTLCAIVAVPARIELIEYFFKLAKASETVQAAYGALSLRVKSVADQVIRTGLVLTDSETRAIAQIPEESAPEAAQLLSTANPSEAHRAIHEVATRCTRNIGFSPFPVESAYASGTCEIGVLRETLKNKSDTQHLVQETQVKAAGDEDLRLQLSTNQALEDTLDGRAVFNEALGDRQLEMNTARLNAVADSAPQDVLTLGEQAQRTAQASTETSAGLADVTKGIPGTRSEALFERSARYYQRLAEKIENGMSILTPEQISATTQALWQAADQFVRAKNFGMAKEMMKDYAKFSGRAEADVWKEFQDHAEQEMNEAAATLGFTNATKLGEITRVRDYARFLNQARSSDSAKDLVVKAEEQIRKYKAAIVAEKPIAEFKRVAGLKGDALDLQSTERILRQRILTQESSGSTYKGSTRALEDRGKLAQVTQKRITAAKQYNDERDRYLASITDSIERAKESSWLGDPVDTNWPR